MSTQDYDEERQPAKGELTTIDGKLAMYVNSNDYGGSSGSRWAIKGSRLRFTLLNSKSTGYRYAFCHDVNPTDGTITVEILGFHEHDVEPTGNFEVVQVEKIGRCDAERSK